jgi:gliding motility-associated-like protein
VSAVILIAIVSSFLFQNTDEQNSATTSELTKEVSTPTIIKSNQIVNQNTIQANQTPNEALLVKESKKISENKVVSEPKTNSEDKKLCNTITDQNNSDQRIVNETQLQSLRIVADRYTCNGETRLFIEGDAEEGEWSSNVPVQFDNRNAVACQVRTSYVGRVLFTYSTSICKDTFTVVFNAPSEAITYQITPENCGLSNAEIVFEFPENRQMVSLCNYPLNDNSIKYLSSKTYDIELSDQYNCKYHFVMNVPQANLIGNIKHDALEYLVDYPIYFNADIELEGSEYVWDFGDGERAYDKKPDHKYSKPGTYQVKLDVVNGDCSESLILKNLEIKDRPMAIPNIFTPNNDGQNDVFLVSVPEETKTFEAIIVTSNGQMVYKWDNPKEGWDGRWNSGQEAESGSYYYLIRGTDKDNKNFEYKSFLELRR